MYPPFNNIYQEVYFHLQGCSTASSQQLVDCLRQKTADELVQSADEHQIFNGGTQEHPNHKWSPSIVVDGMFLPEEPLELYKTGKTSNVPYMTGVTSDEGFSFAQYFVDAFEGNVDKMRNIGEVEFKTFMEEILRKLSPGDAKMAAKAASEFYSVNGTFGPKALTTAVGDFMFAAHARRQAEYCAGEYSDFLFTIPLYLFSSPPLLIFFFPLIPLPPLFHLLLLLTPSPIIRLIII